MQLASLAVRQPLDRVPHHAMLPPRIADGSPLWAEAIDADGQKGCKYRYTHTRDATEEVWIISLAAGRGEQHDANRSDRDEEAASPKHEPSNPVVSFNSACTLWRRHKQILVACSLL